eukprot:TRINITY_DN44665_c0_g1_i1.p1 TRINITY_DN44665_c0_g1~~TRINITY_DN44665_c0_g1_i1.p1  ORF type:complete len:158 (+),score=10.56 TRINITY_DN44665_c0_g1_i1:362-835(+)
MMMLQKNTLMFDSTFDQAKAFSTSSSDDGSCVSVDAFYSPDWYTDGKQYGYRPKAKTNGLSTRRTGASGGGLDLAGHDCSATGYVSVLYRMEDDHACFWGICKSYTDISDAVAYMKGNYGNIEFSSAAYPSYNLGDTTITSSKHTAAETPVWVAVRV